MDFCEIILKSQKISLQISNKVLLYKKDRNLQGRVRFPTGGKAREPRGMIR